jgi:hypothetical protein
MALPVEPLRTKMSAKGLSEARCTKGYLAQSEEMIVSSAFAKAD